MRRAELQIKIVFLFLRYFNNSFKSFPLSFLYMIPDNLPAWFDRSLEALYYKKRDRSGISYLDRTLDGIMRGMLKAVPIELSHISIKKHTWEDLEAMIEETAHNIQQKAYPPNLVIGIKSGGALIAKYVAQCLGSDFT